MARSGGAAVGLALALAAGALTLGALTGCREVGHESAIDRSKPRASASRAAAPPHEPASAPAERGPIELAEERHLRNVRRLTDGGENAEAYWSWDGTMLTFQARRGEKTCDDIYVIGADGAGERRLTTDGAHTCSFFLRGDERILFSSTMSGGAACPPPPDRSRGYSWALYGDYEIYTALADGSDVHRLTESPGYDAEGTVGPDGRIVFTSVRDGDLDVYVMDADGSDVRRLTDTPGYDGGAVFSPDGRSIAYRASHPVDPQELADYRELLGQNLVRPGRLDIWVMDTDGSHQRPLTGLGAASFAPAFTPDGGGIIFASNHEDPRGRNFDLYVIRLDGTGLERVTVNDTFDGFPLFAPDGRRLAFCSNRGDAKAGETNVFVADWVP